jgi:hypothetical protein
MLVFTLAAAIGRLTSRGDGANWPDLDYPHCTLQVDFLTNFIPDSNRPSHYSPESKTDVKATWKDVPRDSEVNSAVLL